MSPGPFSSTAVLDGMSGILGCTRAYRPMALSSPAVSRNGRSDGRQLLNPIHLTGCSMGAAPNCR